MAYVNASSKNREFATPYHYVFFLTDLCINVLATLMQNLMLFECVVLMDSSKIRTVLHTTFLTGHNHHA